MHFFRRKRSTSGSWLFSITTKCCNLSLQFETSLSITSHFSERECEFEFFKLMAPFLKT